MLKLITAEVKQDRYINWTFGVTHAENPATSTTKKKKKNLSIPYINDKMLKPGYKIMVSFNDEVQDKQVLLGASFKKISEM